MELLLCAMLDVLYHYAQGSMLAEARENMLDIWPQAMLPWIDSLQAQRLRKNEQHANAC